MRRAMTAAGAVLCGVVLLAGCGADPEEPPPAPMPTVVEQGDTAEPEPEDLEPDGQAVCEGFFGNMDDDDLSQRALAAVTGIGDEVDQAYIEDMAAIGDEIDDLLEVAPGEMTAPLRQIQLPFTQAADILAAGGGEITFDTGAVRDGVPELMEACADAGYTVGS